MKSLLLAIESSCDETSVALLSRTGQIRACIVRSQIALHIPYGGVVPELAARDHLRVLPLAVEQALDEAEAGLEQVGAIAVTQGPGLVGALLVGVQYARTLGRLLGVPVYGINHLFGHILAARLEDDLPLPALVLLVSGGHTQLVGVDEALHCTVLGGTVDDAVGEAFDKVAKLLDLPYPGGPEVSRRAANGHASRFDLPRPLWRSGDGRISMSGLKTAVVRVARELGRDRLEAATDDLCASFEQAVVDVLVRKTLWALSQMSDSPPKAVLLTGGVAANPALRQALAELAAREGLIFCVPDPRYCTDNAAMIGAAGLVRWLAEDPGDRDLEPRSRWSLEQLYDAETETD